MNRRLDFVPTATSENLKPHIYPDCVHLTEYCGCNALQTNECSGMVCAFRQTVEQSLSSRQALYSHLNSLSEESQQKIALSY